MNFFLCDDDKSALDAYSQVIKKLCVKHNIECKITCYSSGESLILDYQEQNFAGILFLDIHMPKVDGISVAEKLQVFGYKGDIIFLTISKEHFLPAFDVGAANYIVKGETTAARFEQIFLKVVKTALEKEQEYMLFSAAGQHRSIPISTIHYFEVFDRVIMVHYGDDGSETFSFFSSLGKLETQLLGRGFVRPHRSYLVAVSQIESLTAKELILYNKASIPVGRKNYQLVKTALAQYAKLINKE